MTSTSTPRLVRVVIGVHEGLIICREHLAQLAADSAYEELPVAQVSFWNHRCAMCGVDPVPGRTCENASCRRELHPQWPAVYCCNECAREDA